MPTRPSGDLIPVRKETKRRLARLKGDASFDALIGNLLARAQRPVRAATDRPRLPDEQLALAHLAAERWRLAVARGQLREEGPRLVTYVTGLKERTPAHARRSRIA
jgi:hypothetical protein